MNINFAYVIFMLALLIGNLMIDGIKKMNGEVFFPDSTIYNIIFGFLGIVFQIRLMGFDLKDKISWGYGIIVLLISLPFFILSTRKRTITIYDIGGDKLEKILLRTFQQYKMPLEKKGETSEFLVSRGEGEAFIKLEQGSFQSSKWNLTIERYRKIQDLDLILEDIEKAVAKDSAPQMGYRGILQICIAVGICIAALWFRRFLYLPWS